MQTNKELNQRIVSQYLQKRKIVKFLEENPEKEVNDQTPYSCPISLYLQERYDFPSVFVTSERVRIRYYIDDLYTLSSMEYNIFNLTKWVKKFVDFVDTYRRRHGIYSGKYLITFEELLHDLKRNGLT